MAYEIYTYGGGAYLAQLFTSLKLFMGSDNFTTLIRLAGAVGLLWVTLEMLGKKYQMPDFMYLVRFAMVYFILLVPKVDVAIVDRIEPPSTGPVVVDSVPLGIGILAHLTSTVGDGLTRMYETYISIPGDQKYAQNGMLFGSSLIKAGAGLQAPNADFAHDMNAWLEQCGFWLITRGIVSEDALMKAPDIWGLLSANASTLRYVQFSHPNPATGSRLWTCRDAMTDINTRWNSQINDAATFWGKSLWPRKTPADAKAAILASAPGAYSYMTGASIAASDLIKQQIMINATRQALLNYASSSDAAAAAVNIAQAQSESTWRVMARAGGNMMGKLLPIFRNVLEAVVYGLFPIVAVALLLPMVGKALLTYVQVLVWLQLWAPIYAIINSIMTWYGQYQNGTASMMGGGSANGLSLETAASLLSTNSDMVAAGGYFAVSIPMIAWMLVKAGAVAGTAVVGELNKPAQSAAQQAGGQVGSGNISLGDFKMDNAAINTWSGHKMDTNTALRAGATTVQQAGGSMLTQTAHSSIGGRTVTDASGAISSPGTTVGITSQIAAQASQASKHAETAAESATLSSSRAMSAAVADYYAYDKGAATSGRHSTGASTGTEGSTGTGAGQVAKFVDQFGEDRKWSAAQSATLIGAVQAGTPRIGVLEASGQFRGMSDAQLQTALDDTSKYMKENNWQEKFDLMKKGATTESYEHADAASRNALAGVRANLDIADGWRQESSVQRQKSAAFEQTAAEMRSSGAGVSTRFEQEMVEWAKREKGIDTARWDGLSPLERDRLGNEFASHLLQNQPELLTRNGIAGVDAGAPGDLHAAASADPAFGPGQVMAQHRENRGRVEGQQRAAGLTPGVAPADTVTPQAQALQGAAQGHIQSVETGVAARGGAVRRDAETKINHSSLPGDAAAGAVTGIIPNVDTPFGNPERMVQQALGKMGAGLPARSEHGASGTWEENKANLPPLPDVPAPNVAPPGWAKGK
ncbi:MAG: conjugal transfer protein TraG N-terminal domain-containing protein [Pseudomonadota bacterium]